MLASSSPWPPCWNIVMTAPNARPAPTAIAMTLGVSRRCPVGRPRHEHGARERERHADDRQRREALAARERDRHGDDARRTR